MRTRARPRCLPSFRNVPGSRILAAAPRRAAKFRLSPPSEIIRGPEGRRGDAAGFEDFTAATLLAATSRDKGARRVAPMLTTRRAQRAFWERRGELLEPVFMGTSVFAARPWVSTFNRFVITAAFACFQGTLATLSAVYGIRMFASKGNSRERVFPVFSEPGHSPEKTSRREISRHSHQTDVTLSRL